MPNITLSIPDELKKKMDQFKEMNWSEVARQAIQHKLELLERMHSMYPQGALRAAEEEQAPYGSKKKKR